MKVGADGEASRHSEIVMTTDEFMDWLDTQPLELRAKLQEQFFKHRVWDGCDVKTWEFRLPYRKP